MAAIDYYTGFSQSQVEAILAAQQAELLKVMQAGTDSGSQFTKRTLSDIHAIIAACQSALTKFDPTTYPPPRKVGCTHVSQTWFFHR